MSENWLLLECPARQRFALIGDDQSTRGGFDTAAVFRNNWGVILIAKQLIKVVRRLLLLTQTSQINDIVW
jgi:hypothetical protein